MADPPEFSTDLLVLPDVDYGFSCREQQTIAVAAAVSRLSYSATPANDLLHEGDFRHLHDTQLISGVWTVDQQDGSMLVAWSPRLESAFIAFRGSVTTDDWLSTDFDVRVLLDGANGWAIHGGFHTRASKLPIGLVELFVKTRRTVLCGHSLGGALATIIGLNISRLLLGDNPQDSWSEDAGATAHLSVITFGAPSSLVKRGGRMSSKPPLSLRRLIHNVIDPADIVPTAFNRASSQLRDLSTRIGLVFPMATMIQRGTTLLASRAVLAPDNTWWKLLVTVLNLCAPGVSELGVHIGNLIILDGGSSFRRVCENNEDTCMAQLSRDVDFTRPMEVEELMNRHKMISYYTRWTNFATSNLRSPQPPVRNLISAHDVLDGIIPDVSTAIVSGAQNPADQKVSFSAIFRDNRARHTFSKARLTYKRLAAEPEMPHQAPLILVLGEMVRILRFRPGQANNYQVELRFEFGFVDVQGADETRRERERDQLWASLFTATEHSMGLVDVFGTLHRIRLPEGIVCPSLTDTRTATTASFLRTAMLRAVAVQVSHISALDATEPANICPEAQIVAMQVDNAVAASSPRWVLRNLPTHFQGVQETWATILVDEGVGIQQAEETEVYEAVLPTTAQGSVRASLSRLVRGIRNHQKLDGERREPYSEFRLNGLSEIAGVPSFQAALRAYSEALQADRTALTGDGGRHTPATALTTLRTTMIVVHAIINTQLVPAPEQIFETGGDEYFETGAVAGMALGAALWWTGYGLIIAGLSYFAVAASGAIVGEVIRPRAPAIVYDQLLKAAVDRLAFGAERPAALDSRSAETLLARFAELSPTEIAAQETPASRAAWKFNLPPSHDFYRWVKIVAIIGRLRQTVPRVTVVGAVGPTRVGKSELLTGLFELDRTVFSPGSANANRTLDIRAHRSASALVVDCPGLDEQDDHLRQASSLAVGLLDVIVVVVDYRLVQATGIQVPLLLLAQLLEQRNGQPVCILLNRVDEAISSATSADPDYWVRDIQVRKQLLIAQLRDHLKGQTHLESVISTRHPTKANHLFVRRARVSLDEIVRPSCLIDIDNEKEVTSFKRDVLRELQSKRHLWDAEDVSKWVHRVCPEAFGPSRSKSVRSVRRSPNERFGAPSWLWALALAVCLFALSPGLGGRLWQTFKCVYLV